MVSNGALQTLFAAAVLPALLAAGHQVHQRGRRSAQGGAQTSFYTSLLGWRERRQRRLQVSREGVYPVVSKQRCLAVLVLCGALAPVGSRVALARDLGARGPLYGISEPDLLQEMLEVMRSKQASGELEHLQEEARRRAIARVETPPVVPGLRRTVKARTYLFDPSVRFDEPVVDDQGRIVIPAGTVGNPLQTVRLTRELLLFDGRDPDQVKLAKARLDELGPRLKPILVAGQPLALTRQWKVQVFFDQDGLLVQRFGIRQVPARITQDGLQLKIEELAL